MEIQNANFSFNRLRGSGPRRSRQEILFSSPVTQAAAFLKGFDVAFSPENDHHLGNLEVRVDANIDSLAPQRVFVEVIYGLRDWSGDWDDYYEGTINVTVIAE